ncbi:hypothetical protein AC578_2710 [Pseudocercospora eumusae]|uniref:Anaphase-promoting complex subunit 4 WD40 domain-containing protein n=1 Tax=Pseudocercospora eumusae TaxID=321146 RepID=A0A139HFX4_9PEZI|nr:hypothetical protein AC578_2710 [Pseudocercospora eumusae]
MAQVDAVRSLALDLPPSCIAFCPTLSNFFVVGTYYLHGKEQQGDLLLREANNNNSNNAEPLSGDPESTPPSPDECVQKRTGSLILFRLEQDNITRVSTITTDFAILDIQWSLHADKVGDTLLAVATSTGLLAFYRLDAARQELVLSCVKRICDSTILVLSLTWHPFRPHVLGLTLSNGNVLLCECNSSSSSTEDQLWSQDAVITTHGIQQHELEAWTMAFTTQTALTLSGGDDILLQCSQIQDEGEDMHIEALWKDRKLHEAGVTAILPLSDTLVVTGSYDDHIRVLSLPSVGRRQTLASLYLGGGVWRLKVLAQEKAAVAVPTCQNMQEASDSALRQPCTSLVLLASCMHAGARIVRLVRSRDEEWTFEVLARFEEHKSMNYGSDVQPERKGPGGSGGVRSIVSTSFYDRLLCLWKIDMAKIVPSN